MLELCTLKLFVKNAFNELVLLSSGLNTPFNKSDGAIFFGIGFWSMAGKIQQKCLKSFLNISAYGLILTSVTNQAIVLLNTLFPPLGLMTVHR